MPRETEADPSTGFPFYRLLAGRQMVMQVVVGGELSSQDVWFSYDSDDYPSSLFFQSCACDVIEPPGEIGSPGLTSLVKTSIEPADWNCTEGGSRVETGLDDNRNRKLDSNEVDQTLQGGWP